MFLVERGVKERVDIGPVHSGGGGGSSTVINVSVDAKGAIGLDPDALAHAVTRAIEKNRAGSKSRMQKALGVT
jgi:hypothetical protein